MKKVLAFVLAVMMLAVVAFAGPSGNIAPGTKILISRDTIDKDGTTASGHVRITAEDEAGKLHTFTQDGTKDANIDDFILRSVSNDNYSVTNVKVLKIGKSLVEGVKINEAENRVEITLKDDLTNTHAKDFEVTFKLKGKVKFTVKDSDDASRYNAQVAKNKKLKDSGGTPVDESGNWDEAVGKKVSLPNLDFTVVGTVGYGKVQVSVGDDGDEELENLGDLDVYGDSKYTGAPLANTVDHIDIDTDIVKFVTGASGSAGNVYRLAGSRSAGSYVADAILTQEYGDALTLEARVYKNDTLFFGIDNSPNRDIIGRLADSNADMDFFLFNSDKSFTTFNSNAILYFNDADEDNYVYQIKDQKLIPVGNWSDDDGCWVVKTRTLGQYVVSDVELKEFEAAAGEAVDGNPDTGANDVVGIATALAAVALVSAAAVSLKK